ncbi:MAG TPA: UbiH/UbiF family hydroxylase [Burkholderiales bacterium]|nr:UbiH/UbiF family hydroxylase [Burkholderiales bacterium]
MNRAADFDVIIVGAGLVGASLACALRATDLDLALVEAGPPPQPVRDGWDSRLYAISPGSVDFLDAIGAWQRIDLERICPVTDMEIFGDDGRARLDFSAYAAGVAELCSIVEAGALARALWACLAELGGVELVCPARCAALDWSGECARLQLEDGRELRGKLIVAADGAGSWVRACSAIRVTTLAYRQTAVVANFSCAEPHRDTARQWFRADGVLALLPMPGARVSMVWSTSEQHATELLALSTEDLAVQVADASGACLGALTLVTPPRAFDLSLQKVDRLIAPRLALAGDAAHNVHPLAGQGVNLGLQDARELARVLAGRGVQTDCGDYRLLRRYERARREDILTLQFTTHALQRLFAADGRTAGWLRNTGLALANHLPPLKHALIERALGRERSFA